MKFDNSYLQLPDYFYSRCLPEPVVCPQLIIFNEPLAEELGILITEDERAIYFSGNRLFAGAEPIALVYAGHQFGQFVPRLGDGRALLLGEVVSPLGRRYDVQLKGAGRTPYSRQGDGRAPLGPMLREYIVSEAMHALGIPTTRALAVVKTGDSVYRETPLPGAVLTRVAISHSRVGTFEYFAARQDNDALKKLADYTIARLYPHLYTSGSLYLDLLIEVLNAQAVLIANWLSVGFVHGVMNTDNMAISGETIDYGPCAFLDEYLPGQVFSSIDLYGRYAFNQQPLIGLWNIKKLYHALSPLISVEYPDEEFEQILAQKFWHSFNTELFSLFRKKIGLSSECNEDKALIEHLLKIMSDEKLDFTLTFRYLSNAIYGRQSWLQGLYDSSLALQKWLALWRERLTQERFSLEEIANRMNKNNPAIIPRNHLIEKAIQLAYASDEGFSYALKLNQALRNPYEENDSTRAFMAPPQPFERVYKTFCGT